MVFPRHQPPPPRSQKEKEDNRDKLKRRRKEKEKYKVRRWDKEKDGLKDTTNHDCAFWQDEELRILHFHST